jgi:hypothetical protein
MLLAACDDQYMNSTLERLLSQSDTKRRVSIFKLIDHLKVSKAPMNLIEAIGCLLDNEVAETAYEYIYKCKL